MGLISSIASVIESDNGKATAKAVIAEMGADGSILNPRDSYQFQYYPESIHDTRDVPLESKQSIGSSHPIYQWVHGGERRISFQAVFTADEDYGPSPTSSVLSTLGDVSTVVSSLKNPFKSLASLAVGALGGSKSDPWNVSVSAAVAWLRSKTYPLYTQGKPVQAPPKLVLWLENSGLTSYVGSYQTSTVPCLMTQCDVEYEAFFRSGVPRIVVVSLNFVEIVQVGKNWKFVNRQDFDKSYKQSGLSDRRNMYDRKQNIQPPAPLPSIIGDPFAGGSPLTAVNTLSTVLTDIVG